MSTALAAIARHPKLRLQIVATGMHLDKRRGDTLAGIRADGWKIDAVAPWPAQRDASPAAVAANAGRAMAELAGILEKLQSDIVLVVGDRVEAFAAAAAAHLSQRIVAHVHGGDRALGQVDDSLRHATTKLAHVHFPATAASARRIARLGEDKWRIHRIGSPGIDGIAAAAAPWSEVAREFSGLSPRRFALLVLHPADADAAVERKRAESTLRAIRSAGVEQIVIVYPNNDPGADGIIRAWRAAGTQPGIFTRADIPRTLFLGLMRDAAVMVGNSSAGIIEAASFGTPVIDIGPRQLGRECSRNVTHVSYAPADIRRTTAPIWNNGHPRRCRGANVYGRDGAGRRMADKLSQLRIDERLRRKLIAF